MCSRPTIFKRSNTLTRFYRSNLTEQQQLKNICSSGNFYLLQKPGDLDQEDRWLGGQSMVTFMLL